MGYNTDFEGAIEIQPPLNAEEIQYLKSFAKTRRMDREKGPYFVEGTGYAGQGSDSDIRNYNCPAEGQPGLWCKWEPTEDGTKIEWNGNEKFYDSVEWMQYIIDHFIGDNPIAKSDLPFLNKHVLHGQIEAYGEERGDHWFLVVENNKVRESRVQCSEPEVVNFDKDLLARVMQEKTKVENTTEVIVKDISKEVYTKKKGRFNI